MAEVAATRRRLVACTLVATVAGHYVFSEAPRLTRHRDFAQVWFAARSVLHGLDPYQLVGPGRAFEWPAPLFYPLPAALVGLPVAPFPEALAMALAAALGAFLFAWAVTRHGLGGLWAIASVPFIQAITVVQWAPIFAGAFLFAPLGVLLVAKPTIGAAVYAAKPSRWPIIGGAVLTVLAFLVRPGWVVEWHTALQAASVGTGSAFPYIAPVTQPGGVLVLLALARWRRPEARLLVALACMPQTTLPYEALLLFLVPETWRQMLVLSALSWGASLVTHLFLRPPGLTEAVIAYAPVVTVLCYLPCTLMVLRRPNEGTVPAWLDRTLAKVLVRYGKSFNRSGGQVKDRSLCEHD